MTLSWYPTSGVGGVNQAIMHLTRVMAEHQEWQPFLMVTTQAEIPAEHPHLAGPVESIYLRAPDWGLLSFLWHLPGALSRLKSFLEERNVRIVSCHFPETESVNFILLRRLGLFKGRVILSFHGEDIRVLERKGWFGRQVARWMMRHADVLVACSRGLMDDLVVFEPAAARNATVIYNAIDIDLFRRGIEPSFPLPAELQGKRFLLNVARYEHKKGQDILIKAFEQVVTRFPDLRLVMMGSSLGDGVATVRALVNKSPAKDRILTLLDVPHARVGVFLEAASIFVLPSRREGFPFVLLEAGAVQKPVVAAACIGVPEIIEDKVTGRLTPLEDADSFAAAISDLLENEEECARVSQNLYELVKRQFNWKHVYEQHVGLAEAKCD